MASDEIETLIIQRLRENVERAKRELEDADTSSEKAKAYVQRSLAEQALRDALTSATHK